MIQTPDVEVINNKKLKKEINDLKIENEILEKVNQLDSKAIDKLKQQYWIEGIILDVDEER